MDVKTYRASSLQAALQQVRRELGPDASVLHTREVKGGMLRWLAGRQIEVTASATIKVPSRLPPPAAPIAAKPLPPADYDDFRAKYRADLKGGETEVDSLVEHLSLEAAPDKSNELHESLFQLFTQLIDLSLCKLFITLIIFCRHNDLTKIFRLHIDNTD